MTAVKTIGEWQRMARTEVGVFVVDRPLYVGLTVKTVLLNDQEQLVPPTLRRHCPTCHVDTNWNRNRPSSNAWSLGAIESEWSCVQCTREKFRVWLDIAVGPLTNETVDVTNPPIGEIVSAEMRAYTVRKIGQWPPPSVKPEPELERVLDEVDRDLYRKAIMNLSQGYGLGALAYFRRVVENETNRLLEVVAELAADEEDEALLSELAEARKGHNADQRLRLIANATPRSLRMGGLNPLKTIHAITSGGVHNGTEDECAEVAQELRASFEYVFRHVRDQMRQRAELRRVLSARRERTGKSED